MDIEQLAVNQVSTLIARCPHLTPYISVSDKIPFTDGHIDMHSNQQKTNVNAIGRVHVQIKGRSVKGKMQALDKYSLRVVDLRAYLNFSGVLYFVVNLGDRPSKTQTYYALLSPFRIQEILERSKSKQKSISVQLKRFPKSADKIEKIVNLALKTRVQNPKQGLDPALISGITEFTIHSISKIDLEKPIAFSLNHDDFAVFAKTKGGMEIALPGEFQLVPHDYIGKRVDGTISCGDIQFESPFCRRVNGDTVEFHLSETLRLTLSPPSSGKPGSINLQLADRLDYRLRDIRFYLGCVDTGEIELNGETVKMTVSIPDNVEEFRGHYEYLQRLETLFKRFAVPTALITLSEITEKRLNQLGALYQSLVRDVPSAIEHKMQGRIFQPVGRWGLELVTVKTDDQWRIIDTFAPGLPYSLVKEGQSADGEVLFYPVTPYEMLDAQQTARTLNLHLSSIVSTYEVICQSDHFESVANHAVLRLIQAADIEFDRAQEFLEGAERLNEWLISRYGEETHHLVNRMQIHAHSRDLMDTEQQTIRNLRRTAIREDSKKSLQIELACAVLLRDSRDIADIINRMESEELEEFKIWPIWNLVDSSKRVEPKLSMLQAKVPGLWMKWSEQED